MMETNGGNFSRNPLKSGQGFNSSGKSSRRSWCFIVVIPLNRVKVSTGVCSDFPKRENLVVIPLNRVKVSTEEVEYGDNPAQPRRNPLKSGQGFNQIQAKLTKILSWICRNPLKSGQGFNTGGSIDNVVNIHGRNPLKSGQGFNGSV